MNNLTLLFGVLLCLVVVNARHYGDRNEGESSENEENLRSPRHRRRRWQMNYGYDYPPPSYPYPERRDYDRNTQEELQRITRLLEELTAYIRRPPPPPPPPQPIYIPYPVPYHYPQVQSVSCTPQKTNEKTPNVNVTRRVSDKDMDPNRIWGLVIPNEDEYDDGNDGSRPISFDPIIPRQVMKRPAPQVEHGSVQASQTTKAPRFANDAAGAESNVSPPGMCSAAILSCCGMSNDMAQQKQCFSNIGCAIAFGDGSACSTDSIQKALESFRLAYSPLI